MLSTLAACLTLAGAPTLVRMPGLPAFPPASSGREYTWAPVDPGFDWDELVVSWNVKHAEKTTIRFEARVLRPDGDSSWYTMGVWSLDGLRTSVEGRKDADGEVLTDTLRLARPGGRLELRAYLQTLEGAKNPKLSLVTLSFASSRYVPAESSESSVWGRSLDVVQRSQMSYPGGEVLCSPTTVSMILSYWSARLRDPGLDRDVPAVESGAIDAASPKTANWPFNMAYAGSLDDLVAYVSRLSGMSDLEKWVDAGIPVSCSTDYTVLLGKTGPKAGHLVLLIGFTKDGDPIFNDPGWSKEVRQVYPRPVFERAWASSNRTVYLVYPAGTKPPAGPGAWLR